MKSKSVYLYLYLVIRCFSFYWFGKREFGKFTNGIPVIGGPARPPPRSHHPLKTHVQIYLLLFIVQVDYLYSCEVVSAFCGIIYFSGYVCIIIIFIIIIIIISFFKFSLKMSTK